MNNKLFNKKQKAIMALFITGIILTITILAFFAKDELISRFSLWSNLLFGVGTLITSLAALYISILSMKKAEEVKRQKIVDDANKFINENGDELLYIPLCIIANSYDNHHKYFRKIYNTFNVLNKDVQEEVLKQLNYDYKLINNNQWIDRCIEKVRNYIATNDLGADLLYDNAKYFYHSINYSSSKYDGKCESDLILQDRFNWLPDILFIGNDCFEKKISFTNYMKSYLYAKRRNDLKYAMYKNEKPIDMVINMYNLLSCEEEYLCYWMMQIVISVVHCILSEMSTNDNTDINYLECCDAQIETFEDRFLEVLMELYNLELSQSQKRDKK